MTEPSSTDGASRPLGFRTVTSLVVASMVGTGVFTTSGLLLADLRSTSAVLLAWGLGGVLALAGALSYAELVAALPSNGGEYHLLSAAYHPALGFASGIVSSVVGFSAPIAASAIAFGHYAHALWPAIPEVPSAVAVVVLLCVVHGFRLRAGGDVQDALTAFKILLIVGFVAVGAGFVVPSRMYEGGQPVIEAAFSSKFAVSLIYVTYSYSGWNAATYVAGEVRRPARTLPLALIAGTSFVTLLYLALNFVFLTAAPGSELRGAIEVGHVAAVHLLGRSAGSVLSAIIALGLLSTVGALIMTGTRVIEAMGRDHGALSLLARRAGGGGPFVAVGLQGGVAVVMVLTASFEALLAFAGFTLSIFAALAVFGVIVLRIRQPALPRPYRTWGYPFTPLVFVALMIWMIIRALTEEPTVALFGGGTVAMGLFAWALVRRPAAE